MNPYRSEWKGSPEKEVKDGTASFSVDGEKFELHLESFKHYETVSKMIGKAFCHGRRSAAETMHDASRRQAEALGMLAEAVRGEPV